MSRQWKDLVKRSRSKKLQPEEYSTGTFTLSNLGMFGAIALTRSFLHRRDLAVAASRPTVVAGKDGSIAVKRQMQVNLTADHRVIYGADGAAFLKDLLSSSKPVRRTALDPAPDPRIYCSAVTTTHCQRGSSLRLRSSRVMTRVY